MTARPRLLDAFCKAGGCTAGYVRAGFDVTGVDREPQPRYLLSGASAFVQADALEFIREHGHEYDAIHASPPCQAYSRATAWRGDRADHPDMIAATRAALESAGRPYVIENVEDAGRLLRSPVMLCGSAFGLRVRRHRLFECPWMPLALLPDCRHRADDYSHDHGGKQTESLHREAMGCDWMTVHESRQAIPPAYTQWIGKRLIAYLKENPLAAAATQPTLFDRKTRLRQLLADAEARSADRVRAARLLADAPDGASARLLYAGLGEAIAREEAADALLEPATPPAAAPHANGAASPELLPPLTPDEEEVHADAAAPAGSPLVGPDDAPDDTPEIRWLRWLLHHPDARRLHPKTAAALAPLLSLPADPTEAARVIDAVDLAGVTVGEPASDGLDAYEKVRPLLIRAMRGLFVKPTADALKETLLGVPAASASDQPAPPKKKRQRKPKGAGAVATPPVVAEAAAEADQRMPGEAVPLPLPRWTPAEVAEHNAAQPRRFEAPAHRACRICGVKEGARNFIQPTLCAACEGFEPLGRHVLLGYCRLTLWSHPDGRAVARAAPGELGDWHDDDRGADDPEDVRDVPTVADFLAAVGPLCDSGGPLEIDDCTMLEDRTLVISFGLAPTKGGEGVQKGLFPGIEPAMPTAQTEGA